jgi:hypothetical protein
MIDALTLPHGDAIYTFVSPEGENISIHAGRLRQWQLARTPRPEWSLAPISPALAQRFDRENVTSRGRIATMIGRIRALRNPFWIEPILFAADGTFTDAGAPNVLLVDGHHRYAAFAVLGLPMIPAWIIPPSEWEPFRITGLPDVTAQELRDLPITPRDY